MATQSRVIEIINWKKFNPRTDVKHSTWFRLQHTLAFDPEWSHFNGEEKWVWVFLMSTASLKNRAHVEMSDEIIAATAKVSIENVRSAIQKLTEKGCIKMRNVRGTRSLRGRSPTDGRTDETDGRNETDSTAPRSGATQLVEIWNAHCGKLPKVRGAKGKRGKAAEARWLDHPEAEYWIAVVQRMAKSKFCRGELNQPGPHESWKADFDFFIRPDTADKVLEGKYDDNRGSPGAMGPVQPVYTAPQTSQVEPKAGTESIDPKEASQEIISALIQRELDARQKQITDKEAS